MNPKNWYDLIDPDDLAPWPLYLEAKGWTFVLLFRDGDWLLEVA